jgi:hypothetical protein
MRPGVHTEELAVGGHHLGGQQVVDREAVLSDQVADADTKGEPADPDRAGVAEPGPKAVRARRGRVVTGGQAGLGPRGAAFGIDGKRPQVPEVQHDPPVRDASPALLWPPLRTASSRPVSHASSTTRETSPASATRTMTAGRPAGGRRRRPGP